MSEHLTVEVMPGKSVEVAMSGPSDGLALVIHTGTPSGLVMYEPMVAAASARGLRLVQYGRPGYGKSDPQPGRRVADAAHDVGMILDHIGAVPFVTVGSSGGGPHALASAALMPDRCLAAATIAGAAPYQADGIDWLAGMAPENVDEFGAAVAGEATLSAFLEGQAAQLTEVTGEMVVEALGELASPADRAALTGEFADHLASSFRAAVSTGIAGWRDDDLAFVTDWGFDLDSLSAVPVSVWQGDQDMMVPLDHGGWLASQIPGAAAHLLPGEGHLSILASRLDDILDELVSLSRRP